MIGWGPRQNLSSSMHDLLDMYPYLALIPMRNIGLKETEITIQHT